MNKWIEYDYHPFLVFDSKGKVKYHNKEAEILIDDIELINQIFYFAINNATNEFISIIKDISFKNHSFMGYMIGFNDEEIGIRLYRDYVSFYNEDENLEEVNIFLIIEFVKNYVFLNKNIQFRDYFDLSLPSIKINKDKFIKTLIELYKIFDSQLLETYVHLKIGEKIIKNNKKYKVLELKIKGNYSKKDINSDYKIIFGDNYISLLLII